MQQKLWCLCIVLGLLITASASFAQAPLYTKNNVLAAFNFNDGSGSSDMTLVIRLLGDEEIYVDEGFDVKYIYNPANADEDPEGWIEIVYDDSAWEDGLSGVGFSDNDDNTTTPAGLISIWTRYYFDAPNASKISDLVLLADYDDQYIAWLNGERIAASPSAPAGNPPAWNASQGGIANHGSAEMAAGKPNEARWNSGSIQRTNVDFKFAGQSGTAVEADGKLAVTWGRLKVQG